MAHQWSQPQCKAVTGLMALTVVYMLITQELPRFWAITLATGQVLGLFLAAFSALYCIFLRRKRERVRSYGCGELCMECKQAKWKDSYHCEICDECVSGHSHHSDWLNTCIGSFNLTAYLVGTASLGVVAGLQVTAAIMLVVMMVEDRESMLRINEKYDMKDGGYLSHLILYFSVFVSISIALSCLVQIILQLGRLIVQWQTARNHALYGSKLPRHTKLQGSVYSDVKVQSYDSQSQY